MSTDFTREHLTELRNYLDTIGSFLPRVHYLQSHIRSGIWEPTIHTGALIQAIKGFTLETGMAIATLSTSEGHYVALKPPTQGSGYADLEFTGQHKCEPIAWCRALVGVQKYVSSRVRPADA